MANLLRVWKRLPDGRLVEAVPLDYHGGLLGVYDNPRADEYDDCFAFGSWLAALCALREWNGVGAPRGYSIHTRPKEQQ